mgnify:CR=1 FL=1
MTASLTILASGSSGNSALVDCDGERWLIDLGLEPKELDARLADAGANWSQIKGVLITHRHSDHWKPKTLSRCWTSRVPVHSHRDHGPAYRIGCPDFRDIEQSRLFRPFVGERLIKLSKNWHCRPFRVRHDGGATYGFRFEEMGDNAVTLPLNVAPKVPGAFAYVADLGCWDQSVVDRLADVDLLALEFNHDPELLRNSPRPPWLVHRILGDEGHLSNAQAAALVSETMKLGNSTRLHQLVLLHISHECNSSALAAASARAALDKSGSNANVYAAEQHQRSPTFVVGGAMNVEKTGRLVQATLF